MLFVFKLFFFQFACYYVYFYQQVNCLHASLYGQLSEEGKGGRVEEGWRKGGGRVEEGWRKGGGRVEEGWRKGGGRVEETGRKEEGRRERKGGRGGGGLYYRLIDT